MKIEKYTPKPDSNQSYWFPFSKGTNRMLLVLGILITIRATANEDFRRFFFGYDEDETFAYFFSFFIAAIATYIVYLVGIWIYQGYKESKKEKE